MSTVVPLIPLPADVSRNATEDGSTTQARTTRVGGPDGVPGFRLQPGPGHVTLWEMSQ